jgi:hypothetical protein
MTMGKDKSGGFHPPKGKPTAIDKVDSLGISSSDSENLETFLELDEQYVQGEQALDPSIPVRHPNRNVTKGPVSIKAKTNQAESDRTVKLHTDEENTTELEELPDILDKSSFIELASYRSDNCATIYMPTHEAGVEVNEKQDVIVLKNALKELSAKFSENNIDTEVADQILTPAYALLKNDSFWNSMHKGLGLFMADGYFKYIRMQVEPVAQTAVNHQFLVSPLTELLHDKRYFYLLVISKQGCKLFRADAYGMQPVHVPDLPGSIEEVKRVTEKDASTFRAAGSGSGGANFHGLGGNTPDDKSNAATYFESVDDILFKEIFNKENAPLLLAGVEYLIPIYKSVCDYHNVCEKAITGNHEHDDISQLYQKARQVMEDYFNQPLDQALTIFANQSATPLTSTEPAEVIPAAFYGRISHLFVARGEHLWGRFNEADGQISVDQESDNQSQDLLDEAVVKTIQASGEVFVLPVEQMPADSSLAAVFRY